MDGPYIVATDMPAQSRHQAARLYRLTGDRNRAELAGQGSVEQMQALADELNNNKTRETV